MSKEQGTKANSEYRGPPMSHLERFYMPAMPPLELFEAIGRWAARWRRRRGLKQLLGYEDHLLQDMGYDRRDILRALRMPLKDDAVKALTASTGRSRRLKG